MAFPKKLLNDHETVALDLHPHWWHFAKPAAMLVVSVVFGIVVKVAFDGSVEEALVWVAIAAIVVCAAWLLISYLQWATTNFVVTSDRVIFRSGMVAKSGIEIPLDRVNNVIFNQSVIERLLGAGDLMIESGGETGQQKFTNVRNPDHVQKTIHAQKSGKEGRMRGGPAPATDDDLTGQLERLEGMLQRGTLTPEEFEQQKRRLLGD